MSRRILSHERHLGSPRICGMRAYLLCGVWDLSSPTRDGSPVPCTAVRALNHWTTRQAWQAYSEWQDCLGNSSYDADTDSGVFNQTVNEI